MEPVEERVAYLEGRVEEHAQMVNEIRDSFRSLEGRVDARFEHVDKRFEQVDKRFEQVDKRFEQVDKRFEQVEQRILHLEQRMDRRFEQIEVRLTDGFSRADLRMEAMDAKMSRHFVWLAGMLLTTLIAMLSTLGAIIAATVAK